MSSPTKNLNSVFPVICAEEKWQAELLPNGDWGIYEGADRDYRIALVENDDATGQDSENAEMCRANANLIAAAPELFAALEKLESWLTHPKLAGNIATKSVELGLAADLRLSLCQARAALAKAGGGL